MMPLLATRRATQSSPVRPGSSAQSRRPGRRPCPGLATVLKRRPGGHRPATGAAARCCITPPTHPAPAARSAGPEHLAVPNSRPQRAVEPLDLPRRRRRPRRGQQVLDAVLAADLVEQHLHRREAVPPGEHLPVISQYLLAAPHALRSAAASRHRPAGSAPAAISRRRHAEPRMIIDRRSPPSPGCRPPAGTRPPHPSATTPSAGPAPTAATPPAGAAARRASISPARTSARYTPDSDGTGSHPTPAQLEDDPAAPPTTGAPAAAPAPAPPPPPPSDAGSSPGRCDRSSSPSRPPASYRASHACTLCRETPHLPATSHDRPALADHRQHSLIPLLSHDSTPS